MSGDGTGRGGYYSPRHDAWNEGGRRSVGRRYRAGSSSDDDRRRRGSDRSRGARGKMWEDEGPNAFWGRGRRPSGDSWESGVRGRYLNGTRVAREMSSSSSGSDDDQPRRHGRREDAELRRRRERRRLSDDEQDQRRRDARGPPPQPPLPPRRARRGSQSYLTDAFTDITGVVRRVRDDGQVVIVRRVHKRTGVRLPTCHVKITGVFTVPLRQEIERLCGVLAQESHSSMTFYSEGSAKIAAFLSSRSLFSSKDIKLEGPRKHSANSGAIVGQAIVVGNWVSSTRSAQKRQNRSSLDRCVIERLETLIGESSFTCPPGIPTVPDATSHGSLRGSKWENARSHLKPAEAAELGDAPDSVFCAIDLYEKEIVLRYQRSLVDFKIVLPFGHLIQTSSSGSGALFKYARGPNGDDVSLIFRLRHGPRIFRRPPAFSEKPGDYIVDMNFLEGGDEISKVGADLSKYPWIQLCADIPDLVPKDRAYPESLFQSFGQAWTIVVQCPDKFKDFQELSKMLSNAGQHVEFVASGCEIIDADPQTEANFRVFCKKLEEVRSTDVFNGIYSLMSHGILLKRHLIDLGPNTLSGEILLNEEVPNSHLLHGIRRLALRKQVGCLEDPLAEFVGFLKAARRGATRRRDLPEGCCSLWHINVTPTKVLFDGPFAELSNRVLRTWKKHADKFLRINFCDESGEQSYMNRPSSWSFVKRLSLVLEKGLVIGTRRYTLLAYSSSQVRTCSAWMFHDTTALTTKDIRKSMGDFSHLKEPQKVATRQGQCFSSTRESIDIPPLSWARRDDIESSVRRHRLPNEAGQHDDKFNFSDGCGFCHPDTLEAIREKRMLKKAPSAVQFRFQGAKGMLSCHPSFFANISGQQDLKMCLRPSQIKFESEKEKMLEICDYSRCLPYFLNRQVIVVLESLGVPKTVFIKLQERMLLKIDRSLEKKRLAIWFIEESQQWGNIEVASKISMMLKYGFAVTEPFAQLTLREIRRRFLATLLHSTHIQVKAGANVFGICDEAQVLKYDNGKGIPEVFLQIDNETDKPRVIEQYIAVSKCPVLHPGDVQLVKGVKCPQLSHLTNCLVFPTLQGPIISEHHPGFDPPVSIPTDTDYNPDADMEFKESECDDGQDEGKAALAARAQKEKAILEESRRRRLEGSTGFSGIRDIPNMLSGADLDGDQYHVCWDRSVTAPLRRLHERGEFPKPARFYIPKKIQPSKNYTDATRDVYLRRFFIDHQRNSNLGLVAFSHLEAVHQPEVYPNGKAFHEKAITLSKLHSDAVDYPKTGVPAQLPAFVETLKRPHFMPLPRMRSRWFHSESLLGDLYDRAEKKFLAQENEPLEGLRPKGLKAKLVPEGVELNWRNPSLEGIANLCIAGTEVESLDCRTKEETGYCMVFDERWRFAASSEKTEPPLTVSLGGRNHYIAYRLRLKFNYIESFEEQSIAPKRADQRTAMPVSPWSEPCEPVQRAETTFYVHTWQAIARSPRDIPRTLDRLLQFGTSLRFEVIKWEFDWIQVCTYHFHGTSLRSQLQERGAVPYKNLGHGCKISLSQSTPRDTPNKSPTNERDDTSGAPYASSETALNVVEFHAGVPLDNAKAYESIRNSLNEAEIPVAQLSAVLFAESVRPESVFLIMTSEEVAKRFLDAGESDIKRPDPRVADRVAEYLASEAAMTSQLVAIADSGSPHRNEVEDFVAANFDVDVGEAVTERNGQLMVKFETATECKQFLFDVARELNLFFWTKPLPYMRGVNEDDSPGMESPSRLLRAADRKEEGREEGVMFTSSEESASSSDDYDAADGNDDEAEEMKGNGATDPELNSNAEGGAVDAKSSRGIDVGNDDEDEIQLSEEEDNNDDDDDEEAEGYPEWKMRPAQIPSYVKRFLDRDLLHRDFPAHLEIAKELCREWVEEIRLLMQQFDLESSMEVITKCLTRVEKRRKEKELVEKITPALDSLKNRMARQALATEDGTAEVPDNKKWARASAAYVAAYNSLREITVILPNGEKKDEICWLQSEMHGAHLSFPWMFYATQLCDMKEDAMVGDASSSSDEDLAGFSSESSDESNDDDDRL